MPSNESYTGPNYVPRPQWIQSDIHAYDVVENEEIALYNAALRNYVANLSIDELDNLQRDIHRRRAEDTVLERFVVEERDSR